MKLCRVTFLPQNKTVEVDKGSTLLDAVSKARITINNLCGGDGICGRCKMFVRKGDVSTEVSPKLTRDEIKSGMVLACMTKVNGDLLVEIPTETLAKEKIKADRDAERFKSFEETTVKAEYEPSPLVQKIYLELEKPTLQNNTADHERLFDAICKKLNVCSMQMGLKIIKTLPEVLRNSDYKVTATVGMRRDIAEIMNVEEGNTSERNYIVIVDMGTTTVVAHLVNANTLKTVDAMACFNSQGIYGREVTRRIITSEKRGSEELQKLLIEDINNLIRNLATNNNVGLKDITAVVCAGNTAMGHFLLGLPTKYIRRYPYVATTVEPPPLRAAEVGIEINPRGLLYSLPGISAWVGSDITAGILATEIYESDDISMLIDIGTNGETVVGNKEWLIATSASAGPALEGASVACGMRAEPGAIEKFRIVDEDVEYETIGGIEPKGICGSGIIDIIGALLKAGWVNRSGNLLSDKSERIQEMDGIKCFVVDYGNSSTNGNPIYITESDIENVITAKAAIFAAMRIILKRLDLRFNDISRLYVAGAFGNYINVENAITIGLLPNIDRNRIKFMGNTSIRGAKLAAFYIEAFQKIREIRRATTYYDLLGANDYVDEFRKALFLPHTDIEEFMYIK